MRRAVMSCTWKMRQGASASVDREERCVQRDRDEVAVGPRAAQLERARRGRAAKAGRELAGERGVIVAMDELAEVGALQVVRRRARGSRTARGWPAAPCGPA